MATKADELIRLIQQQMVNSKNLNQVSNKHNFAAARSAKKNLILKTNLKTNVKADQLAKDMYQELKDKYKTNFDCSKADYMVTSYLLELGFVDEEIISALQNTSPELAERKAGHIDDYCNRTLKAVKLRASKKLSF